MLTAFFVGVEALTAFHRKNSGINDVFCWYKGVNGF